MAKSIKHVVVTGSSGKAGRAVVRHLLESGYEVLGADLVEPKQRICRFVRCDLTDLGQTYEVLREGQAVVHLAAIPGPGLVPDEPSFRINVLSTYNVFSAAATLGYKRVVSASSETTLGLPFERVKPAYFPVDEQVVLYPESAYAMSKVVGEEMARQFARWHDMTIVSLRFSNIMEEHDYATFPAYQSDARHRKWNVWGYVDARDVAQSCRLGLEADVSGAESFIIAAADTVMERPSRELAAEIFPGVPIKGALEGRTTLLSIDKARKMLGYAPGHSWMNYAGKTA